MPANLAQDDLSSAGPREAYPGAMGHATTGEEMEVDIMSFGGSREQIGTAHSQPLSSSNETGLPGIGLHSTITQLRQANPRSTLPSPSPSPGPSTLSNDLTNQLNNDPFNAQIEDGDVESAYDGTPDPNPDSASTSRAPSRGPPGTQPNPNRSQSPSTSASPFPQPFAFGKTQLVPGKRIPRPKLVLQAPVALYQPLGDDDDLDEGNKAVKRKGKSKQKQAELEEQEEEDDRLYCICKSRYDANVDRAMIACDKCENWYHLDCVKIDEDRVHLVDQFICPVCATTSTERTTWKAVCLGDDCLNAVVPLSKYCGDFCGQQVLAGRFQVVKVEPLSLWDKVSGARRVEAAVIEAPNKRHKLDPAQSVPSTNGHATTPPPAERDESQVLVALNKELDNLTAKRAAVGLQLGMIESRMRYLRLAIRRWEKLCADFVAASAAIAAEDGTAAAKPKGKAKKPSGGPTSAPEAICGFDVRLVASDEGWAEFVESELGQQLLALDEPAEGDSGAVDVGPQESYEGVLCMAPRKKCERHKGWQQVRDADFQVELIAVEARLDRLAQQDARLRTRITDHEAGAQFRALYDGRSGADANGRVASPGRSRGQANGARAPGVNKGGRPRKSLQTGAQEQVKAEAIELPPEVLAGLSRTQQRQMQQLQGAR